MAWALRLSAQAEQDIVDILAWTAVHFSEQQASTYSDTLTLALEALIDGPDALGVKSRNVIAPGVMTLHVARSGRKGRHFVVFRAGGNRVIDVLRVLHDSMDLPRHVATDANQKGGSRTVPSGGSKSACVKCCLSRNDRHPVESSP